MSIEKEERMNKMAEDRNEWRADLGVDAVSAAARQTGTFANDLAEAAICDVLAYIAHACDRFGLDPEEMFQRAAHSYAGDFEDGPGAKKVYDGTAMTLADAVVGTGAV